MTPYTDEQIQVLEALMPRILFALRTADDAARGYGYDGARRRYDIDPANGLANIESLELGALLDELGDWCWCADEHAGQPCPETAGRVDECSICRRRHGREVVHACE